jgi:hypothetical protein
MTVVVRRLGCVVLLLHARGWRTLVAEAWGI